MRDSATLAPIRSPPENTKEKHQPDRYAHCGAPALDKGCWQFMRVPFIHSYTKLKVYTHSYIYIYISDTISNGDPSHPPLAHTLSHCCQCGAVCSRNAVPRQPCAALLSKSNCSSVWSNWLALRVWRWKLHNMHASHIPHFPLLHKY